MQLRSDLGVRAVVRPGDEPFVASPMPGVERLMLDRDGGEVARATTIVRYAPGSRFSTHLHERGEEFLVLDGVFADERGSYPAGTYVRNPPGSSHAPYSEQGCTLFVKLRQFQARDAAQIVIDTRRGAWRTDGETGVEALPLHEFGQERVQLLRWAPGAELGLHYHAGGEEILVLDGAFADEHGDYPRGSWLRNPPGSRHGPRTREGCTLLVKTGHLA
jgi:anti-sigma factor ChrR (cupin superfamily)